MSTVDNGHGNGRTIGGMAVLVFMLAILGEYSAQFGVSAFAQTGQNETATRPAVALQEPAYGRTTFVSPEMIRRPPRQVIVLPSEPGEVGEDPLQLSSGVLGKLPTESPRLPEGYIVSGAPATVGRRGEWTVVFIAGDELFSLLLGDLPQAIDSMGELVLSPGLLRSFQDNHVGLAADAELVVVEKGRQWRLADAEQAYVVQREGSRLSVHRARALRVLPNRRLMMLEAIVDAASSAPLFVVTGRVTEFQGVNYILFEHLAEVIEIPGTNRASEPRQPEAGSPVTPSRVELPDTKPAGPGAEEAREPRAEEIIAGLMESRPLRAVVLPEHDVHPAEVSTSRPADGQAGGATGRRPLWVEDTMLIDRPGRVVPGERWWMFAFEDKGETPDARPVPILPNRMLETALAMSGGASKGSVFIVSGEVTEYRGGNYLLVRKVLVQPDMGNLR